jgi:hypothetical protein
MAPSPENDDFGFLLIMRDFASTFSPEIVDVAQTGSPLPVEPDPDMVDMAVSGFEISRGPVGDPDDFLSADIDFVGVPTYGTYYFLSGRHCAYPETIPIMDSSAMTVSSMAL